MSIVYTYSRDMLAYVLAVAAHRGKPHPSQSEVALVAVLDPVLYLHGYLSEFCSEKDFEAKTIVVEDNYVDRDYLTDYAGFYSTAFQPIEKKTTRLHFFSESFDEVKFEATLLGDKVLRKMLTKRYLGFVVVRPMTTNFMGRTCLKHYPRDKSSASLQSGSTGEVNEIEQEFRFYSGLRDYDVDLFGLPLKVRTIAFQEQDSVVGACASAAIYALLHGIKSVYDNPVYSALEITRIANGFSAPTATMAASVRSLPNTGLSFGQMYQTLGELDLSPTMVSIADNFRHRVDAIATIYAYLSAGLPVLSHVALLPEHQLESKNKEERMQNIFAAEKHAFTITGFSMRSASPRSLTTTSQPMRLEEFSRRITKFYVHCDRIGPFAKFLVTELAGWLTLRPDALKNGRVDSERGYEVDELAYRGIGRSAVAIPIVFIVPTSEKLRLAFSDAYEVAQALAYSWHNEVSFAWDIKVAENRMIKADWLAFKRPNNAGMVQAMRLSLPRFCWRVIAHYDNSKEPAFELLLDSTAVEASDSILAVIVYSSDGAKLLELANMQTTANSKALETNPHVKIAPRILTRLIEALNNSISFA